MTNNLAHLVLYQLHGRSIKQFAKEAGISQSYLDDTYRKSTEGT
jgi:hypothetical protein